MKSVILQALPIGIKENLSSLNSISLEISRAHRLSSENRVSVLEKMQKCIRGKGSIAALNINLLYFTRMHLKEPLMPVFQFFATYLLPPSIDSLDNLFREGPSSKSLEILFKLGGAAST